jgi:hypothetical protein
VDKSHTRTGVFLFVLSDHAGNDVTSEIIDAGQVNSPHPVPVTAWCIQELGYLEPLKQFRKIGAHIFRGSQLRTNA